ncbi:hypothetical protein COU91_00900 [Candidatus Saccharibacteria bacterium CG10_big_fil_rev_8_21_14_0_10_47_8]|nr:MAG: hypothetical protein COU91_00900 [Candidatus Saccharibacteria bacterium CG10_big_fil_rev_8_21_14_0_10_47_8]
MKLLEVRVKPGSKKGPLVQLALDGSLLVYVREPAADGKANNAVTQLLAKYLDVPKTNVQMISGYKSKIKHFKITKK